MARHSMMCFPFGGGEWVETEAVLYDAAARAEALTSGLLPLRPRTEDARNRVAVP